MKRALPWIVATLLLSAAFHLLTIWAYPYYEMVKLGRRGKGTVNAIHHGSRVTAESRQVVRPSPDLIYSTCGYDLSQHPLKVSAAVPDDTYWSVSMFAANTDNFFVLNDRQARGKKVDLILAKKDAVHPSAGNITVVESPSTRGLVLFRMLVTDEAKVQDLIRTQKMAACRPLE